MYWHQIKVKSYFRLSQDWTSVGLTLTVLMISHGKYIVKDIKHEQYCITAVKFQLNFVINISSFTPFRGGIRPVPINSWGNFLDLTRKTRFLLKFNTQPVTKISPEHENKIAYSTNSIAEIPTITKHGLRRSKNYSYQTRLKL